MSSHYCICERMYERGETNYTTTRRLASGHKVSVNIDAFVQSHVESEALPEDWFRRTYDSFAFGQPYSDEEQSAPRFAVTLKNRIEASCPAPIHYPRLSLDRDLGRDVYTSTDAEKRVENLQAMEDTWFDASHPWAQYGRTENRGADSGAGHSDVLQRQREDRQRDIQPKAGTIVLSSDEETALSHAERKAFRSIRAETDKPSPFLIQTWRNKKRIRAQEEQARRDIAHYLRRLDQLQNPETIAWVRASVEKRGYFETKRILWKNKARLLVKAPKAEREVVAA